MQDSFSIKPINSFLKDCITDRNTISYVEKAVKFSDFIDPETRSLESKIEKSKDFQFKKKIESLEEEIKFLRENNSRLNKNNFELEEKLEAEKRKKPKYLEKIENASSIINLQNKLNKSFINEKNEKCVQVNLTLQMSQLNIESPPAGVLIPNFNVEGSSEKFISEKTLQENVYFYFFVCLLK